MLDPRRGDRALLPARLLQFPLIPDVNWLLRMSEPGLPAVIVLAARMLTPALPRALCQACREFGIDRCLPKPLTSDTLAILAKSWLEMVDHSLANEPSNEPFARDAASS